MSLSVSDKGFFEFCVFDSRENGIGRARSQESRKFVWAEDLRLPANVLGHQIGGSPSERSGGEFGVDSAADLQDARGR
jgi:hypothetical protein